MSNQPKRSFPIGRQTNPDSLASTRFFLGLILPNAALFVERIDDCVQPFRYDRRTSCDLDESNFSRHGHSPSTEQLYDRKALPAPAHFASDRAQ